ncbi:MAG: DUF3833 family protein [Planktomarina sp.]|jgi:hypothetical protein|nr:DUF3833 family protein [Planktomarina sp.]MDT2032987.1 DUF3833 family protein [Planktomarina sp.]MDT2040345.1 DUF3833 family protein [Planktomarina sp.]MDT2049520.1 DUF3833 family protein [Planktomarina sp.]|tara:strand:- start:617 stop:1192 length:576 start_codon:yes stop_codon:yes gene_type:complete
MTFEIILLGGCSAILIALFLKKRIGFQAQKSIDYESTGPQFDIRKNLNGPMLSEGIIYGPFGRVTSRFVAKMQAEWDGDVGQITEVFDYDSGNSQKRKWTLKVEKDGSIKANAQDLVGTGYGYQSGSAVVLNYTIKLTEDAGGHALKVTDWMYLMENGVVMNRSQFRKFGIKVAELVATMRPENSDQIVAK